MWERNETDCHDACCSAILRHELQRWTASKRREAQCSLWYVGRLDAERQLHCATDVAEWDVLWRRGGTDDAQTRCACNDMVVGRHQLLGVLVVPIGSKVSCTAVTSHGRPKVNST